MMFDKIIAAAAFTAALAGVAGMAHAGKDLDAIKARGQVVCGVTTGGISGFMSVDSQGKCFKETVEILVRCGRAKREYVRLVNSEPPAKPVDGFRLSISRGWSSTRILRPKSSRNPRPSFTRSCRSALWQHWSFRQNGFRW